MEKGFKKFKVKDMSFKDSKVSKLPLNVREKNVQFLWVFNCYFFNLLSYTPSQCSKGFKGQTVPLQLIDSGKVSHLLLSKAKLQIVKNQIEALGNETSNSGQHCTINRNAALRFEEAGKVDD